MKTTPVKVTLEFSDSTTYTVNVPMRADSVAELREKVEAIATFVRKNPEFLDDIILAGNLIKRMAR